MKILYVITGLGLGGAEKVVADLADQMALRGHEVKIIYLTGPILVRPKFPIEIIGLNLNSIKDLKSASKKYREIIKSYQPDVVHSHMVHANIFTRINRLFTKISKLICTAHNSNEGGKARMIAYKLTNFLSDLNTNVSKEASNSLIQKGAFTNKNLITIYNGINLSLFKKNKSSRIEDETTINFLSVGRFNTQKDYPNLLKAISIVTKSEKNIHFNIAGEGNLRAEIEKLIEDLSIQDYVTLLGNQSDIPNLMNNADFFVLSSSHEGLPTVLIEAIACELFVIATDCGGSKEILNNTGMLVPIQNSEALAEAIIAAIHLPKKTIEENNITARKFIEDTFDLSSVTETWINIYEER